MAIVTDPASFSGRRALLSVSRMHITVSAVAPAGTVEVLATRRDALTDRWPPFRRCAVASWSQ